MTKVPDVRSGAGSGWRRLVAIGAFFVVGILPACGGGDTSPPSDPGTPTGTTPGPVARLEVSPTSVVMTAAGEKRSLRVKAFDANGIEVPNPPLSFTSSRPEQVSVAADGAVGAVTGLGSALIGVASGTVAAAPVLATVVQTADGVVLVDDAQVTAPPLALTPDPNAAPGTAPQYSVRLSGVGRPAAGTLMVGTGGQPVAGRVVSTAAAGDQTDVVLETVPLPVLFKSAAIDVSYTAEQTTAWFQELAPQQPQAAGRTRSAAAAASPLSCKGSISRDVISVESKVKVTPSLAVGLKISLDQSRIRAFHLSADGKLEAAGKASIKVSLATTGSFGCKLKLGTIVLPVTGPLSVVLAPTLPIYAKVDISGQFGYPAASLSAEVKDTATLNMALDYSEDGGLEPTFDGSIKDEAKFDANVNEAIEQRMKASAFFGLSSSVALGNVVAALEVLDVEAGPQLEASFGSPYDVSQDAGFQAGFQAKKKLSIGYGGDIKDAIKALIGKDVFSFSPGLTIESVVATSPKSSSVTIDRDSFAKGDNVAFKVELDPSSVTLPVWGYNVKEVRIYRLVRDFTPLPTEVLVATAVAAPGQTSFDLTWVADVDGSAFDADTGKEMFYAFVVDSLLSPVSQFFPFELGDVKRDISPAFRLAGTGASIFAIGADGQLRAMGSNDAGSLGAGLPVGQGSDTPVAVLNSADVVSVTGSAWFGAMLKKDGSVWVWGWGPSIGSSSRDNPQPFLTLQSTPSDRNIAITSGYRSSAVVTSGGLVYRFGDTAGHEVAATQPGAVAAAEGLRHTLILTSAGKVYGWGDNRSGQIGTALAAPSYSSPVQVPNLSGIVAISAGDDYSLALKKDGTVWAWGDNSLGQLGLALGPGIVASPTQVPNLGAIKKISAGEKHALALDSDGRVWAWGYGDACRLGTGDTSSLPAPKPVFGGASDIDAGEFSSLFLRDGAVWRAGRIRGFTGDACLPELTSMPGSVK